MKCSPAVGAATVERRKITVLAQGRKVLTEPKLINTSTRQRQLLNDLTHLTHPPLHIRSGTIGQTPKTVREERLY